MEKEKFEQEPKLNIDEQIDNQKEALEKDQMSREEELEKWEEKLKKWEELEKLEDEWVKLMSENNEKWDLMVAANNEEWAIMEKMHNEIDELYKTTEDPIKIKEVQGEIENKYEPLLNNAHMKERTTWQVWEEVDKKLNEKRKESKAIADQLFKKETNQE